MIRLAIRAAIAALLISVAAHRAWSAELDASSDLVIHVTPYIWLPTLDSTVKYPVLGGGTATTTLSSGPGDWIPKLNLGVSLAADVSYDRFVALTDFMYVNANTSSGHIRSFDLGRLSVPVDATISRSTSIRLESAEWTLAGGYTILQGSWGSLDLIAGVRLLNVNQRTNFSLSAEVLRPDGTLALGRFGGFSASRNIWNGIGGVRGRIYLADAEWLGGGRFYLPFYFDVGGGGSNPTWQAFGGLGYQTARVGVSIGYRYLAFHQGSSAIFQKLSLGGPILAASISF